MSARVINQRGVLSISNKANVPLNEALPNHKFKRIIISKGSKRTLRKVLELYSVNDYSIYQDLDSLSKQLNRFVTEKDPNNLQV